MNSGWYILGTEVAEFEKEFSSYLGCDFPSIGVGSGTEALHLALRTLAIGPGDGVITVSHTAVATVAAVELAGAVPIFADIDPLRMTMDPSSVREIFEQWHKKKLADDRDLKIKAILPVHMYGQPADMPALSAIAKQYGVHLLEDCAQAHGADISGRRVGNWGDCAAFSFYPTKNLGGYGDGGALICSTSELREQANLLRQYGWRQRYISEVAGMNSRLDELQAALLRIRLKRLDIENDRRIQIAKMYNESLQDSCLRLPASIEGTRHVYHQYVVRTPDRDRLQTFLDQNGVTTARHYPLAAHQQPAYAQRIHHLSLQHTDSLYQELLSLPMYPGLRDDQVERICTLIRQWQP